MRKLKGFIAKLKLNRAVKKNKMPKDLRELHRVIKRAGLR